MFDTQNLRMAAQATMLFPLHPLADGEDMDEKDRRQVIGVYPYLVSGITPGPNVDMAARGRHGVWEGNSPFLLGQYVIAVDKSRAEL